MKLQANTVYSIILASLIVGGVFMIKHNSLPQGKAFEKAEINTAENEDKLDNMVEIGTQVDVVTKPELQQQDEHLSEALSEQFALVATSYKQQSRYPNFSTPISNVELAKTPEPFTEARVALPTFDENGQVTDMTIASSVDKLSYLVGEPITFQVTIDGLEQDASVFADIDIKEANSNTTIAKNIDLRPVDNAQNEFRASMDSASLNVSASSQELLAVVDVQVNGRQHVNTVPFILSASSATLTGVRESKQQDDYLEIALEYDVDQSGYYFVSAYLDDAKTGRPLLALQSEGKMSQGTSELILKAHHQALKDAGSQGPYQLRVMQSFKGAAPGEGDDVMAAISQPSFSIPDFSFDGYTDTPYSDPAVDARIQALLALGGSN